MPGAVSLIHILGKYKYNWFSMGFGDDEGNLIAIFPKNVEAD